MPFAHGPIVPEFPEPAANPSGGEETVDAAAEALRKIAEEGGEAEAAVDRVEEEKEAEPEEREEVGGYALRDGEGKDQAGGAGCEAGVFGGARNFPWFAWERGQERLDEIGRFEDGGRDGGEGPGVAEECEGPFARDADVGPILEAEIIGFENEPERNREQGHAGEGDGRVVEAGAIGEGEDGGVGGEDVGGPGDGGEEGGDGLDAAEEEGFGSGESEDADPAVRGEWATSAGAEIARDEEGDGADGDADAESEHGGHMVTQVGEFLARWQNLAVG